MAQTAAEIRRKKLRNRTRQAIETRDQKGLGKKSILDWGRFVNKKPMNFEPTHGKELNLIDFLPFVITQKWYKDLRTYSGLTTNLQIGDWDYKLELPIHRNVGENNDNFLCLRLAFGQKCIRCDEMFDEYNEDTPNEKKIRDLKSSWRCWYNTYDYNEENNPDGIESVWEDVSFYLFEKEILAEAQEGEDLTLFSCIDEGKSVEIKCKEKSLGKNKFLEASNIEFKDREPYDKNIIETTVSFDALVKICTPEEFERAHLGLDENDNIPDKEKSESSIPSTEAPTNRRSRQRPKPEKEEPADNSLPWTEKDGCPNDLEFGNPDLDFEGCKNCSDDVFDACAAVGDQAAMDKKAKEAVERDNEKEETPPTRRRRRQR